TRSEATERRDWAASIASLHAFPAGPADHAPRLLTGVLAVFQHLSAVHPHVLHAGRILVRLLVRRSIRDRLRIERNDVGEETRRQFSALLDPQRRRRQRRQLADRLLPPD